MTSGWSEDAAERVRQALVGHIERGAVPGLTWIVARGGDERGGEAGVLAVGGPPMPRRAIFRIASLTKPMAAVGALSAIEDGVLALDDPVEQWLPELADRRVLRHQAAALDDTVAAARSITVRDLLTFTSGYGYDFAHLAEQTQIAEYGRLGLGVGPPAPAAMLPPDEWIARLGTIPLDHQPGAAWRYHVSAEILGVLLARAEGRPLGEILHRRVFAPAGMVDTAFSVEAGQLQRMTTCYVEDADTGARRVYDAPDGQWAEPPAFPSAGGGLVSTAEDVCAFGRMLLAGGVGTHARVLSRESVAAMTADQLPAGVAIGPDGATGWGYGVDVQRRAAAGPRRPGSYGWVGGLGTIWMNDPSLDLVGVLLTNQAMSSPELPPVMGAFWDAVYAALR